MRAMLWGLFHVSGAVVKRMDSSVAGALPQHPQPLQLFIGNRPDHSVKLTSYRDQVPPAASQALLWVAGTNEQLPDPISKISTAV